MTGTSLDDWLNEKSAEAHNNTGAWFEQQGQLDDAAASYRQALALKPDYAVAHNNLGNVLKEQGKLQEALACYHEALRCQPDYADAHNNVGNALQDQGKFDEALACYQEALRCRPDYAEVYNNLGVASREQGQLEQALAYYEQALRLKPDYVEAHCNRALAWILAGHFEQGWREYEWRWQRKEMVLPHFQQPLWDGSPLEGRTILLFAEQGLGDTLQFIRYAPRVQARGGRVVLACQPALLRLLASCPGIDQLAPQGSSLPPFDVYAPLLSIPRIFQTSLATVPAQVPYLFPDVQLIDYWRRELSPVRAFRIGIAWDADPRSRRINYKRCIPLAHFALLARLEGVRLVSLQKGPGVEQLRTTAGLFPVTDLGSRLDEASGPFMDSAALMKSLDLVVTADIAVAHLAGALGVPVWVALSYAPDWRWLLQREDSPWYPSLRLFRQREWDNWQEVFERMTDAVQQLLAKAARPRPVSGDSTLGGT